MKLRYVGLLTALSVVVGLLVPVQRMVIEHSKYHRQHQRAQELVLSLADRRPPDVTPEEWEIATGWAANAFGNTCISPSRVSLDELKRFSAELEIKTAEDVDIATIDWIWQRLSDAGPAGKRYYDTFYPEYRKQLLELSEMP